MCAPKTALFGPFRPLLSDCVWKNDKQPSWLSGERLRFTFVLCLIPAILHEPVLGSSAYAPLKTVEKESKTGERLARLVRQSARFGWNSLFFLYVLTCGLHGLLEKKNSFPVAVQSCLYMGRGKWYVYLEMTEKKIWLCHSKAETEWY